MTMKNYPEKKNQSMQTTHNVNAPSLCPNALRAILRHETHKWTQKSDTTFRIQFNSSRHMYSTTEGKQI